uniref:SF1-HH domain-containing protein n=1 Tax=Rhodnius prolixus TaxID=13249 RepID=T1HQP0_RHOPR
MFIYNLVLSHRPYVVSRKKIIQKLVAKASNACCSSFAILHVVLRQHHLVEEKDTVFNLIFFLQYMNMQVDEEKLSLKREFEGLSREERRKRKKSRWGSDEMDKSFILGMPTVLPTNLTKEQEQAYLRDGPLLICCQLSVQLQIEEVSRKLRTGDLGIPMNPEE